MQKVLLLLFSAGLSLSLSSCDQLVKKLTAKSIEGFYTAPEGRKAEFTASKVILTQGKDGFALTLGYKVEGNHVFLDTQSNVGGLGSLLMSMNNIEFQVIDDNTLKYKISGMKNETVIYKRVSQ